MHVFTRAFAHAYFLSTLLPFIGSQVQAIFHFMQPSSSPFHALAVHNVHSNVRPQFLSLITLVIISTMVLMWLLVFSAVAQSNLSGAIRLDGASSAGRSCL